MYEDSDSMGFCKQYRSHFYRTNKENTDSCIFLRYAAIICTERKNESM